MAANSLYISTKHKGAMRAHPDNWKMMAKIFFSPHFAWTDHHYVPLCHCLQQHDSPTSNTFHQLCNQITSNVMATALMCGVKLNIWLYIHTHVGCRAPSCMCGVTACVAKQLKHSPGVWENTGLSPTSRHLGRVFFMVSLPMKISTSMLCARFCLHHMILQCV